MNQNRVIWRPQEQQKKFMERPEYESLYGGAAGGGKSDALVIEATRQVTIPWYKGLIIRRTFPQLEELIEKSLNYYPMAFPGARYNASQHFWRFPSGAKVIFGSMNTAKDRFNYQGKAYDFIGFDELTHFTLDEYMYLYSRNRPNGPGTRVYIRATANPGGVGHGWVKDRFITAAPPMTPIKTDVEIVDPDGNLIHLSEKRIFVPATVFDNQELLKNDPTYIAKLAMMPEAEKNALLYGDWDSFSGQVFAEWKNDPKGYRNQKFSHVIAPFEIPSNWRIYRGFDFGYAKPFSVGWYAVDEDGCIYRIRELYGCTGTPNVGVKWEPTEMARKIKEIEAGDPNLKGKKIYGIADPSIFDESRGESIGMMMQRAGVYWNPGDNTRLAGKMQFHYRLAFDEKGRAMFYVFNTNKHFIRTIPSLVYDQKDVEDVDTNTEDHIYDETRYVFMDHPLTPRKNVLHKVQGYDPLHLNNKGNDKYEFYRL